MAAARSAAASWLPMNNNVPQPPPARPAVGFERHSQSCYLSGMATSDTPRFRLLNLSIQDFRGIDSLKLDFTDGNGDPIGLAVIAGSNGCGKTSVLEAILLLARQDLLPEDVAPDAEQVRFGKKTFKLQADLQFTQGTGTAKFSASRELYPYVSPHERPTTTDGPNGQPDWPWPKGWRWKYQGVEWPQVEYFSARREPEELGATPGPQGARSTAESRRLVELKRRLVSTYYRSLRSAKLGVPMQVATPFAKLQRLWSRFSDSDQTLDVIPVSNDPGSGDEVVVRDAKLPIPDDVTSLAQARLLAQSRTDIPRMVPLDRLSSGQIALLTFAGPLVFRDQPADIVLIDEPEQHLHVQWQQQLLPALRELSPHTQFIVATHSIEILEAALSYERFILVRDDDPRAAVDGDAAEPSSDAKVEPTP